MNHCTENREPSWRHLCHHRGLCRLSSWGKLAVTTVMTKLALWQLSILGVILIVLWTSGYRLWYIATYHEFFESESLFVSPCFIYTSSGDRQCITLDQSLWTMDQFLLTNKSQECELWASMWRNIWYWSNQIHADKPHCATIGPKSTQCYKLDPASFWHIMAHLQRCNIL